MAIRGSVQIGKARVALDRRTILVLMALVVGMTVTSSLLLVLEPGPVAPLTTTTLMSIEQSPAQQPEQQLFDTPDPLGWRAIVIHDSRTTSGSAETINAVHEQLGRGGLGYHFVINNGTGEDDGMIEVGFRWKRQFVGAYLAGEGAELWNRQAVGICMIGDGSGDGFTPAQLRELVWLVRKLQDRFGIASQNVFVDVGKPNSQPQDQAFPHFWFRQQLAN